MRIYREMYIFDLKQYNHRAWYLYSSKVNIYSKDSSSIILVFIKISAVQEYITMCDNLWQDTVQYGTTGVQ